MSRSYKHTPGFTDGEEGTKSFFKKIANKVVRHSEIDNGGMYRKLYCSYNICDYKWLLFQSTDHIAEHIKPYKVWIK